LAAAGITDHEQLPLGVVLGSVDLHDCQAMDLMDLSLLSEQERCFGDYRPGRYAWFLRDASPLAVSFTFRGRLGLFDVPDDLLYRALKEAV
jgi:hypothetical protein